jgi:hypothetical protein
MKKVAIVQSNYIPWRGYFDLINSVDEFIFFDDVQYTRRDWRNRNKIIINNKPQWLTLPLLNKGNYNQIVSLMKVKESDWHIKHLDIFKNNYFKAKYFNTVFPIISELYRTIDSEFLSDINQFLIKEICNLLNIRTTFRRSSEFYNNSSEITTPTDRLLDICIQTNCKIYISGELAKNYLDIEKFSSKNIKVFWFDYKLSKEYKQSQNDFITNLSIIDCLMHSNFEGNKFLNTIN